MAKLDSAALIAAIKANPLEAAAQIYEARREDYVAGFQAGAARSAVWVAATLFRSGITKESLDACEALFLSHGFATNASQHRQKLASLKDGDAPRFPELAKETPEAKASSLRAEFGV